MFKLFSDINYYMVNFMELKMEHFFVTVLYGENIQLLQLVLLA